MKIALTGVSHWHVPLYLDALERPGLLVTAVSDPDERAGATLGKRFSCRSYRRAEDLLAAERPDFVFAFAPHDEMAGLAAQLIDRRIAFAAEKPLGLNATQVGEIRRRAEAIGLFVAVPLVQRLSDLTRAIEANENGLPTRVHHLSVRFIAGPPQRYIDGGSPWMLDPARAGGGCLINLGVHFIDLAYHLSGSAVVRVFCVTSNRAHELAIEDHAAMVLEHEDGCVTTIAVGYGFPSTATSKREFVLSLATDRAFYRADETGLSIDQRTGGASGTARRIAMDHDPDPLNGVFATRSLADFQHKRAPLAGLDALERAMAVVDAAYRSARTGQGCAPGLYPAEPSMGA